MKLLENFLQTIISQGWQSSLPTFIGGLIGAGLFFPRDSSTCEKCKNGESVLRCLGLSDPCNNYLGFNPFGLIGVHGMVIWGGIAIGALLGSFVYAWFKGEV
jgi:hypothetical protein